MKTKDKEKQLELFVKNIVNCNHANGYVVRNTRIHT
jgi:hypothetical protein